MFPGILVETIKSQTARVVINKGLLQTVQQQFFSLAQDPLWITVSLTHGIGEGTLHKSPSLTAPGADKARRE